MTVVSMVRDSLSTPLLTSFPVSVTDRTDLHQELVKEGCRWWYRQYAREIRTLNHWRRMHAKPRSSLRLKFLCDTWLDIAP
jgi:hypothetical protein